MSEAVHILSGFNTAAAKALRPGDRTFITTDSLSCGPLEPLTDAADWKARRLAFWRGISDFAPDEVLEDLLGDTAELVSARKVVIWEATTAAGSATAPIRAFSASRPHRSQWRA